MYIKSYPLSTQQRWKRFSHTVDLEFSFPFSHCNTLSFFVVCTRCSHGFNCFISISIYLTLYLSLSVVLPTYLHMYYICLSVCLLNYLLIHLLTYSPTYKSIHLYSRHLRLTGNCIELFLALRQKLQRTQTNEPVMSSTWSYFILSLQMPLRTPAIICFLIYSSHPRLGDRNEQTLNILWTCCVFPLLVVCIAMQD